MIYIPLDYFHNFQIQNQNNIIENAKENKKIKENVEIKENTEIKENKEIQENKEIKEITTKTEIINHQREKNSSISNYIYLKKIIA